MKIYPVVPVYEVELPKSDNGVLRYQRESKSLPFSTSLNQWTDIHTEKYTGFSFIIFIAQREFCIIVAYFSGNTRFKYNLRILGSVDDSSMQTHASRILFDSKVNRI